MDGPGTAEMTKWYTMEWERRQQMEYGYMTGRGRWNKVTWQVEVDGIQLHDRYRGGWNTWQVGVDGMKWEEKLSVDKEKAEKYYFSETDWYTCERFSEIFSRTNKPSWINAGLDIYQNVLE